VRADIGPGGTCPGCELPREFRPGRELARPGLREAPDARGRRGLHPYQERDTTVRSA